MTAAFVFEQLDATGEIISSHSSPVDRGAEIVAAARAQAAEIEREARERGFAAGHAEGLALAEAETVLPRSALQAAAAAVDAAQHGLAAAVELRAVELAVAIAERILGVSVAVRPEQVCEIVGAALRRTLTRDHLVIDVNPEEFDLVRQWLASGAVEGAEAIELHPERRVARGGCVVRTAEGEIDAQLSEQLARTDELLRRALTQTSLPDVA